jgi:hypothetical protein
MSPTSHLPGADVTCGGRQQVVTSHCVYKNMCVWNHTVCRAGGFNTVCIGLGVGGASLTDAWRRIEKAGHVWHLKPCHHDTRQHQGHQLLRHKQHSCRRWWRACNSSRTAQMPGAAAHGDDLLQPAAAFCTPDL